jgi:hypothetical protein
MEKTMTNTTTNHSPTHSLFVVQGEGEKARWVRIGAAWPNRDGKGFSMSLDATPVTGRLVMRAVKATEAAGALL